MPNHACKPGDTCMTLGHHLPTVSRSPNPAAADFLQPEVCCCLSVLAGQHAQQGPSKAVLWKDKLQTHLQSMGTTS